MRSKQFDPANGERVIITGTGRAGTTFLVQLFTALGFDTGFTREQAGRLVDAISLSGLERPLSREDNPYILKSPWFADRLAKDLAEHRIRVSCAIIPVRNLIDAAESRRRVYFEASKIRTDPQNHPGSLWRTDVPSQQEAVLAIQFYGVVDVLVAHRVPIVFLSFPRLVEDANYCCGALSLFLQEHGVGTDQFVRIHNEVANPALVHRFRRHATVG